MKWFKVDSSNGKSYAVYSEEGGKFFVQHVNWSEKLGLHIPQTKKRISETAYTVMLDAYGQK